MALFEKLDMGLGAAFRAWSEQPVPDSAIAVSITFTGPVAAIEAAGFELHSTFGDKAYGVVRFADIETLAALPSVIWIAAGQPSKKDLDTAVHDIKVRATNPIAGTTPVDGLWHANVSSGALTSIPNATGRGVIVAVIDTGIDYTHPMFIVPGSSPKRSRVLKIWDQGLTPDSHADCPAQSLILSSQTYGVEFEHSEIEAALNGGAPIRHRDCDGHGTHVAGIAAGGTNHTAVFSDAERVGVAPEADIIAVKFLDNPDQIFYTLADGSAGAEVTWPFRYKDAVLYCLRTARALGKPIVLNMSFGDDARPGDGLDEDAQFTDALLDPTQQNSENNFPTGAIVVKTMGNEGDSADIGVMARVVVPASGELLLPVRVLDIRAGGVDKKWLNCRRRLYKPELGMHFWYRRAAAPLSVRFALRTSQSTAFGAEVMVGGVNDLGIRRIVGPPANDIADAPSPSLHRVTLTHENNPPVTHPSGGTIHRHHVSLVIKPKESGGTISYLEGIHELRIRAPAGTEFFVQGAFNAWDEHNVVLFQIHSQRPDGTFIGLPDVEWNNEFSTLDPLGRNVITVGAYDDTNGVATDPHHHAIAAFSSKGPLRDYSDPAAPLPMFEKPDIAAPGVKISSAESIDHQHLGFKWPWWYWGDRFHELGGTSMAAPMISGLVALMLQKKPNLNVTEAKAALFSSPRPGVSPSAAPSSQRAYGRGMVDGMTTHVNTP